MVQENFFEFYVIIYFVGIIIFDMRERERERERELEERSSELVQFA